LSPLRVAGHGLLAGCAASLLLSVLVRLMPGMEAGQSEKQSGSQKPPTLPQDPFDPKQVQDWQSQVQSPARSKQSGGTESSGPPSLASPTGALVLPLAPGPEGLAEQFAYKVAAGLFGYDISRWLGPAGMATHLTYGSLWGALYGLIQATTPTPPLQAGPAYGLFVWLVGPAALVPAMKLMPPPWRESPPRAALLVFGHIAYGLTLAAAFDALRRESA